MKTNNKKDDALIDKLKTSLKEPKESILEIEKNGYKVAVSPFFRDYDKDRKAENIRVNIDVSKTISV